MATTGHVKTPWLQQLAQTPLSERGAHLRAFVEAEFRARLLMSDTDDLPYDKSYFELGLTSLGAVEIQQHLETEFGRRIDAASLFNNPTLTHLLDCLRADALSEFFATEAAGAKADTAAHDGEWHARKERVDDLLAELYAPACRRGRHTSGKAKSVAPDEQAGLVRELLLENYEPIAIVGMGLRLPGGNETPEQFASFLRDGRCGIEPLPRERWDVDAFHADAPGSKGKIVPTGGGFVSGIDQFDAKFFNISPKEADCIDPQQRLILECAWKALESANIDPATLRGCDGGVYVGIGQTDYVIEASALADSDFEAHMAAGASHSAAPGRVSYFLGWRGPCVAVDTACSSSLAGLHFAVQGLRRRECSIALCGGVNAIHHPRTHIMLSQANSMLAADGRCKTFDDSADGYGRSEGCVVLVLKRLSDARRDGDTILALVRGSSVRQDGERGGLTVPNGGAQVDVMRQALANAMLEPGDVQYVEAHGTGTQLGDPIEMGAIANVFSQSHRTGVPLIVGSVKTNIGHLEAGAGVSGVAKVVLQLHDRTIYPHVGLHTPSRHIPWESYPITVPSKPEPWVAARPCAVVNSFGFAGTIASVVLEAPPSSTQAETSPEAPGEDAAIFTLSARSAKSLRMQVEQLRGFLTEHPDVAISDLCYTTNVGRSHLDLRLASVVSSRDELAAYLDKQLAKPDGETLEVRDRQVAFLFTGQGSQYIGMGRGLHARHAVFREHLDECDRLFTPHLGGRSIRALMFGEAQGSDQDIHQTLYTQPALFSLEYAVAQLWMSWGVKPNLLLGHSIGEIVAATLAGLFTLSDAVTLVAARARSMQSAAAPGTMIAVRAAREDVAPVLEGFSDVSFGAINAPQQCVVSGGRDSVAKIAAALEARGLRSKPLPVSHAFHSPLMAEVFDAFRSSLQGIVFREPELSFVSNLTGEVATLADVGNAEYWVRHIGEPVDFMTGMRFIQTRGAHVFIEVGPSGALTGMGKLCGDASAHVWVSSLDPSENDALTINEALAQAYSAGIQVAWAGVHGTRRGRRISLPFYPFDRKRYWLPIASGANHQSVAAQAFHHPLLGPEITSAEQRAAGEWEFSARLGAGSPAYLADHIVMGQVVFPGAGYVEVLLAAQDAVFGETSRLLEDIQIREPLFLNADATTEVRTRLRPADGARFKVEVVSRIDGRDGIIERVHATAMLGGVRADRMAALVGTLQELSALADSRGAPESELTADDVYAQCAELGLPYGPEFQRVRHVTRHAGGLAVGDLRGVAARSAEHLPPSVLDGAMHTLVAVAELGDAYLPVGFDRVEFLKKPKGDLQSLVRLRKIESSDASAANLGADIAVLEQSTGRAVLLVHGLRLKRVANAAAGAQRMFHEPRWMKRSLVAPKAAQTREVLVVHRNASDLAEIAPSLAEAGVQLSVAADSADAGRLLAERPGITDLCWFWRPRRDLTGAARLRAESEQNYEDLLRLVGVMEGLGHARSVRILLVSEGAQWLPGDAAAERSGDDLAGATLWGFGHCLLNEYPASRVTLIDLPAGATDWQALVDELSSGDAGNGEYQIAYRGGVRHVKRLVPLATSSGGAHENFELSITQYGQFTDIKPVAIPEVAPVGDEVAVEVRAAGLNFKDVLNALGMLREYALERGLEPRPLPLGFEAAGTVIAAGPDAEFKVGDDVVVCQLGCMKKRVTVASSAVVAKPSNIDFAQAAGLPAAYITAYHALHHVAKIRKGDRVLIHAAAGGVGQAAVQLAKLAGAEVFATASPKKWRLLKSQGVRHIMNSRKLDFPDEIARITEGRGVDIVLNSLNKDYIAAGLESLGQGGRFVELGKIGVWSTEQVRAERPDVAYANFDLSELPEAELTQLNKQILRTVTELVASGALAPLPTAAYALDEVDEAFGVLSRGANTGKLVLRVAEPTRAAAPPEISPNETYLITGGLGALGMHAGLQLARRGARHLAVVSRRAVPADEIAKARAQLGEGVELIVCQGDVSDAGDVARIVSTLAALPAPLGGVIHAAGSLADAPAARQTLASIHAVFAPKVYGTFHLHEALAAVPSLRFFLVYSSVSGVLGVPGQSNYAAANAFMDVLMHLRAARGLPALAIDWGLWADIGMSTGLTSQRLRSIEDKGVRLVKPAEGARALWQLLARPEVQVFVLQMEWGRYVAGLSVANALYKRLLPKGGPQVQVLDLEALLAQPKAERKATIGLLVRAKVADVLHFESSEDIALGARFSELGLDSLAAVELKNALETAFRIPLPTSMLFDYPGIQSLTDFVCGKLVPGSAESAAKPAPIDPSHLTDTQADAELAALREYAL